VRVRTWKILLSKNSWVSGIRGPGTYHDRVNETSPQFTPVNYGGDAAAVPVTSPVTS
jgi:hypothetical protein